jgi:chaperone modulatory protein CbpM
MSTPATSQEMVEEGIVEPEGQRPSAWRFNGIMLRRVQTIVHLERDLDVNLPGAALIVELIDELEVLKRR